MELEVLLSCMNQKDISIVNRSNIHVNVVLVNQTDAEKVETYYQENQKIQFICTKDRGLSRSRNLAIKYAKGDICLISDDDEIFIENLAYKVVKAFERLKKADIIIFKMSNRKSRLGNKIKKINYFTALQVSSWQIAFRKGSIIRKGILFDSNLGAGTENGGGEEIDFLWKCLKKRLKIYYLPIEIGTVAQETSTWFHGFTEQYFYQRGATTRYYMGKKVAYIYGLYFIFAKYNIYKHNCSLRLAFKALTKGIKNNITFTNLGGN